MQHCDPEDLALVALGESPLDEASAEHLARCQECQAEVESLRQVVAVGRSIDVGDQPTQPPPEVWGAIVAEIEGEAGRDAGTAPSVSSTAHTFGEPVEVADLAAERERRSRRRWAPTAVAAAVCLVLGGIVGGVVVKTGSNGSADSPVVIASGALEPVPGGPDPQTTGSAKLERANGQYVLQVDATGLRKPDGFYEVWMMDPKNSGLVAIGTFNANQSQATFPVPAGLRLTEYTSVDISDEPFDGVPGHSTVSVLRGNLTA